MRAKAWALILSLGAIFGFYAGVAASIGAIRAEGYASYGLWRLCAEILAPAVTPAVMTGLAVALAVGLVVHLLARSRPRSAWLDGIFATLIVVAGAAHLLLAAGIHFWPALDERLGRRGRADVLLIVIDTLRADHLGSYGYWRETSPHLDALTADSILWRRAISHAPWTSPSVGSLLTSLYPAALGYGDSRNPSRPDDRVLYLPEILRENGYETEAIVSHTYVAAKLGFDQGFDRFDEDDARGPSHISSKSVTDKAIAALERPKRRPFFLLAHYFDPHFNYRLHPRFDFDPGYEGDFPEHMGALRRAAKDLSERDVRQLRARYDSEIRFTDEHIGRLITALREHDLYDDTMIVVTADHGEALRDRDDFWIGHTKTLFQEAIHVPLLIKMPGGAGAGTVVEEPLGLIDLLPSLIAALDLRGPRGYRFDGKALPLDDIAALTEDAGRPVFSETTARGRWLQSVVQGQWKLIFDRKGSRMSFFDLEADPGERINLAADPPPELHELARELRAWNQSMDPRRPEAEEPPELTEKEQERLRALGYL